MIVANLKMNLNYKEALNYKEVLNSNVFKDLVVCFPNIYLQSCKSDKYYLGSQNGFYIDKGAYTGEVSFSQLKDLNVDYCIIGHSERRVNFFESDEVIHKKLESCIRNNIIPIICIGDNKEEKLNNKTFEVLNNQITTILNGVEFDNILIAYEPFYTIGTTETLSKEEIEKVHLFIKKLIKDLYNKESKVLYGGGVNKENVKNIYSLECVDGLLIGSASVDPNNLLNIIELIVK